MVGPLGDQVADQQLGQLRQTRQRQQWIGREMRQHLSLIARKMAHPVPAMPASMRPERAVAVTRSKFLKHQS
jgi:hypothetical protein